MGKSGGADTPVMRQFLAAKAAHPDALLFFRLGDFYELFFEDAVTAARALDLTLTSRNKGSPDAIPMAGVPYHAASTYIQRLLEQGFKVALCEQMADPATTKGIVPREVVRVVTPGIAYDDAGLEARENLFLGAVDVDGAAWGVAVLDLSTGELLATAAPDASSALAELVRLDPREVLLAPAAEPLAKQLAAVRPRAVLRTGLASMGEADAERALGGLVPKDAAPAVRLAAARCLAEARACEMNRPLPVARVELYELGDTLVLDEATVGHLELVRTNAGEAKGSLLHAVDATKTAPGARLLRRRLLAPKTRIAEIQRRLDAVELFVTQPGLRAEVRQRLGEVRDLERLVVKLQTGRAQPRDLAQLRATLLELAPLRAALEACPDQSVREVFPGPAVLDDCGALAERLVRELADEPPLRVADGDVMKEGFDPDLDEQRGLLRGGQRAVVELETQLREATQIGSLKVRYTRVFGWYLEVTRAHLGKVPPAWRRKQTIATGERYTCDERDALADKLAHAEERCAAREAQLFTALVSALASEAQRLREVAARLAEIDVASALAEVAHRYDYARPVVDEGLRLEIEDGRHPVVEQLAAAGRFVPNDVVLDAGDDTGGAARLWLVTGPNMAGKSTLMRQVALCTILAQMGSFVPARRARIGVVDRVLTRVGASDNLSRGESTFMVEMKETANVLRRATRRSLVLLDEIGRGTSTYDGLAIAWAVAEYLHDVARCRTLFATHYHELTELATTHPGCENWSVSAREHQGDIVFLHKLARGAASRSYGVACARLAGLPESVLARAKALLCDLEQGRSVPKGRAGDESRPQLDLFAKAAPEHPALELLRAVDPDRLTPLEALQLVASLKKHVS
jgi:DNA mismatch repair protein MutS